MQFNPLFIQTIAQTDSAAVVKPSKLTNSSYLFSDIIRIINENMIQNSSAQKNINTNILSSVQNSGNKNKTITIENLIPVQQNLNTQNQSIKTDDLQTINIENIDLSSLVKKLSVLLNALGVSAKSINLQANRIITDNELQNTSEYPSDELNNEKNGNPAKEFIIDLTGKLNSLKNSADSVETANKLISSNLEEIYSLIHNLFFNSNSTLDNKANTKFDKGNYFDDNTVKNNSSKDNESNVTSDLESAILNLFQGTNNVEIKLPSAEFKINVSKEIAAENSNKISDKSILTKPNSQTNNDNNKANNFDLSEGGELQKQLFNLTSKQGNSTSNHGQDVLQNKNAAEIKLSIASVKINLSNELAANVSTKLIENTHSQNPAVTSSKNNETVIFSAFSENSSLRNQPADTILNVSNNSSADLNEQDFISSKVSNSIINLAENLGLQPVSAKMNNDFSVLGNLKSNLIDKSELKTAIYKNEDTTSLQNEISIQSKEDLNSKMQFGETNIQNAVPKKLDQNLLKDVESITTNSNQEEIKNSNTSIETDEQLPKPAVDFSIGNKNSQTKNENILVQTADNSPKIQNDNSQTVNNFLEKDQTPQPINSKSETSTDNHQSKNNLESNKSNDLELFVNQLNNEKNNSNISDIKNLSAPNQAFNQAKTIKISDVVNEITNMVKQGSEKSIILNLKPESLGSMKVTVDVSKNTVHANVEVDTEAVKLIVQNNINDLKQSLSLNGMQLNSFTVNVSGGEQKFGKAFSQKKKSSYHSSEQKVEINNSSFSSKSMGYNTYEYLI